MTFHCKGSMLRLGLFGDHTFEPRNAQEVYPSQVTSANKCSISYGALNVCVYNILIFNSSYHLMIRFLLVEFKLLL
jgi:hypothetical protein